MKDQKLKEIEQIFKEEDRQNLIHLLGAPDDEYNSEALMCYEIISKYDTLDKIQQKIWDIFYYNFCNLTDANGKTFKMSLLYADKVIGTVESYKDFAEKVMKIVHE